jgi:site-specific recombinase XerD
MDAYLQAIATKAAGTRDAYRRILRDLSTWLAAKPGGAAGFAPDQLTQTAVTIYLEQLLSAGYSRSHCARVKAVISGFARYLIEEHGALRRNPARGQLAAGLRPGTARTLRRSAICSAQPHRASGFVVLGGMR